jgi:hypothetical protein
MVEQQSRRADPAVEQRRPFDAVATFSVAPVAQRAARFAQAIARFEQPPARSLRLLPRGADAGYGLLFATRDRTAHASPSERPSIADQAITVARRPCAPLV